MPLNVGLLLFGHEDHAEAFAGCRLSSASGAISVRRMPGARSS
jgi:hypothetical protein